jgi:large subunit ribosomal protein L28
LLFSASFNVAPRRTGLYTFWEKISAAERFTGFFLFARIFPERIRKGRFIRSRICDICGKHPITGNAVSHAKNHTRRTWKPYLLKVKIETGDSTVTLKICARCLKSGFITKKAARSGQRRIKRAVRGFPRGAVTDGSADERC